MTKYDALKVSTNVVRLMEENGFQLDHIKLQKLLYFFAVEYFTLNQEFPFKQQIEKWKLGPVVREVYREYKINGSNQIQTPASTLTFKDNGFVFEEIKAADLEEQDEEILNNVILEYGNKGAFELVELTHQERAWIEAQEDIINRVPNLVYSEEDFLDITGAR